MTNDENLTWEPRDLSKCRKTRSDGTSRARKNTSIYRARNGHLARSGYRFKRRSCRCNLVGSIGWATFMSTDSAGGWAPSSSRETSLPCSGGSIVFWCGKADESGTTSPSGGSQHPGTVDEHDIRSLPRSGCWLYLARLPR